jgi:hypothetical protein
MEDLNLVLARSHEFAERLIAEIETADTVVGGERAKAASAAAELAFELPTRCLRVATMPRPGGPWH